MRRRRALLMAASCLIDAALLFEVLNLLATGRLISPAICALFVAAALPVTAEEFCLHARDLWLSDSLSPPEPGREPGLRGLPEAGEDDTSIQAPKICLRHDDYN
jgi:hypothetical protein